MLIAIVSILAFLAGLPSLVSCLKADFHDSINKVVWILVILLLPIIGPILYFIISPNQRVKAAVASEPRADAVPWYFRTWSIIIGLGSVGPLALPMIWWHPRLNIGWKIAISVVTAIVTWMCIRTTVEAYQMLKEFERTLQI